MAPALKTPNTGLVNTTLVNTTVADLLRDLHLQATDVIKECAPHGIGPCFETSKAGRGFAVFPPGATVCRSDILIPGFNLLPKWILAVVYIVFLLYIFAGVALASDAFMEGIIAITSTTRKAKRKNERGETVVVDVKVWNWVVANISLMALGASMPEIAMTMIEAALTLGEAAGEMGPGTIMGSAAYNITIMPAVCMIALPHNTYKKIDQLKVYGLLIFWGLWAYIWTLVVYLWWTPDEVTIAEGVITFAFFWLMVWSGWATDNEIWKRWKINSVFPSRQKSLPAPEPQEVLEADAKVINVRPGTGTSGLTGGTEEAAERNRAYLARVLEERRRLGFRWRSASSRRIPAADADDGGVLSRRSIAPSYDQQVMFRSAAYSFLESAKVARVAVIRVPPVNGSLSKSLRVRWKTEDGEAISGLDYVAAEGVVGVAPGQACAYIDVTLLDDSYSEPDVFFYVKLAGIVQDPSDEEGVATVVVQDRARINIVDDDDAGMLGFQLPEYEVRYSPTQLYAEVTVVRRGGADGDVQVDVEVKDESAVAGVDYVYPGTSTLTFENGQKTAKLRIFLLQDGADKPQKSLLLSLKNPSGGAELSNRTTARVSLVSARLGTSGKVDAGDEDDDDGSAATEAPRGPKSWYRLLIHYFTYTWRIVVSLMSPPPEVGGGYPCFIGALLTIVGLAYLMNEAGYLFGCVVGLKPVVTGISILTLGTSVPDTIASYIATLRMPNADIAINNVHNSNSVNVYIGLALPWMMCSAYYRYMGVPYATPADDLGFCVMLFACIGTAAVIVLIVNRGSVGELGGPKWRQWTIFFIMFFLWLTYIVVASLPVYGHYSNNI